MNFAKMTLEKKKKTYLNARDEYYNKEKQSFLTDREYDGLEDLIKAEDPDWKPLHQTGVPIRDGKNEYALERFMPSLEKSYPEDLTRFVARQSGGTWTAMDKLDGTALQLKYDKRKPVYLRTRGDGISGRDVSYLIPALLTHKKIPKEISVTRPEIFRLEGVIKREVFDSRWSREILDDKGFDNARQAANGAFLRQKESPVLRDIDLVVLGIFDSHLVQGLEFARAQGFKVVTYVSNFVTSNAEEYLGVRKAVSEYEIDGLVLAHSTFIMEFVDEKKPKNAFAFKINNNETAFELVVQKIEWKKTRLKRWQPKIKVKATKMDGVMVEQATAHNPAWMIEKGIGPGAVVKVLRSGGVIPKIVDVVKKAPFVGPPGPYEQRGRFFYMLEDDAHSRVRAIHFFMTTMGIELLAQKTIEKLYDQDIKSIDDYIVLAHTKYTSSRLIRAGLGPVQSLKIANELKRVLTQKVSLKSLMVASGKFDAGMGERKLSQIEAAGLSMRDICNMKTAKLEQQLLEIKGFQEKTVKIVVDGVRQFRSWYKPHKALLVVDGNLPTAKKSSGMLEGTCVSFTGYRDQVHEQLIDFLGGQVIPFGSKTTVLLYDPDGKPSTKIVKAGKKAMTWAKFVEKYNIPQSVKTRS